MRETQQNFIANSKNVKRHSNERWEFNSSFGWVEREVILLRTFKNLFKVKIAIKFKLLKYTKRLRSYKMHNKRPKKKANRNVFNRINKD